MKLKAYWFPALMAVVLIFSVSRLVPHLNEAIALDHRFSEKIRDLPSRVSSGEISADAAINYVSQSVPKYLEGSTLTLRGTITLLYDNAVLFILSCFFSSYLGHRAAHEAHNKSFKGTPDGAP